MLVCLAACFWRCDEDAYKTLRHWYQQELTRDEAPLLLMLSTATALSYLVLWGYFVTPTHSIPNSITGVCGSALNSQYSCDVKN